MARKYLTKNEAAGYGWYSQKELKALFRLKPAKSQYPAGEVWQGQGTYSVYDKEQCIAMKPYRKPTANQLKALADGRDLKGSKRCKSDGCNNRIWFCYESGNYCRTCNELRRKIQIKKRCLFYLSKDKPVCFLDTETTGIDSKAEIIEIAAVDQYGKELINTLIKPVEKIPAEATKIHGILDSDVAEAPTLDSVFSKIKSIYENYVVLIYNADFDNRLIEQSAKLYNLEFRAKDYVSYCLMKDFACFYGDFSSYHQSYTWQSLSSAANYCGVNIHGEHRAKFDCLTTLGVFNYMSGWDAKKSGFLADF